jgi:amidohydrolase
LLAQKELIGSTVRTGAAALWALSHRIHGRPEVAFEEERSSAWVAGALSDGGFDVTYPAFGLPTAFVAEIGPGPLEIVLCAEYDALPGVGHACGHNMIAATTVGAALALAKVATDIGLRVKVLGTPAEEICDGGGKILLQERGAFDSAHAAMMLHPWPTDLLDMPTIASSVFDVCYHGTPAHAAAFPDRAVNAGAAMNIAEVAIAHLRMHLGRMEHVSGIITKGGDAPNIVPHETRARYMVRADTVAEVPGVRERVLRCFEAGAVATGCRLEVIGGDKPYAEMHYDTMLNDLYRANSATLGRILPPPGSQPRHGATGSTDMGNVSLRLPSIHPMLGIDTGGAVNHQPEFAAFCATPDADAAVIDGSMLLAWTAFDAATRPEIRESLLSAAG